MRVVVTGANGFIGSHLVEALLAEGHEVTCLVRPASDLVWIDGTGAEIVRGSLGDAATKEALQRAEIVYHLAGATTARSEAQFLAVNEGVTRAVLEICAGAAQSPPHFVYLSSLAAAGPSQPDVPLSEDMPPRPISSYGRSKLAGEQAVTSFAGRLPATIVRPPAVYGPRDRALLSAFRVVKRHLRPTIGGARRVSLIEVQDLAAGLLCVMRPTASQFYYLTHPEAMTMGEFGKAIARAVGARTLPIPMPDRLVRVGGALSEMTAFMYAGIPPFNRDKALEMMQPGWECDGSLAARELGFRPTRSHDEALAATAAWYRAQRWL